MRTIVALVSLLVVTGAPPVRAGDADVREQARNHYETGLALFDAGDREQALVEFRLAHELYPSNGVIFMMAQSEYHLGRLKDARAHYQVFLEHESEGPLAETARLRIAAIDRRPSVLVINTVPDDVAVKIEGEGVLVQGQAPNEFSVPRGTYRISVSLENYETQVREVEVGIAETRPLFFKLEPVPGRLSIRTDPPVATLFVRGMRAENPYSQQIEAGTYEIYAEAPSHESRRETVQVEPGQHTNVSLQLGYVQRSGRPELIAFWGLTGAAAAVGLVVDLVDPNVSALGTTPNPAPLSLLVAAAGVGAVSGGLLGARITPSYIPDNRAMYRIGAISTGALAGVLLGVSLESDLTYGLLGGLAGASVGTAVGLLTDAYAPSYGRVTLIQSSVAIGALAGLLAVPAFGIDGDDRSLVVFAGLGLGLSAGLAGAYLPDQSHKGVSWQRMVLIDLTVAAGAFAGAVVSTIPNCKPSSCEFEDTPATTQQALVGGFLGLAAGWLLTRGVDEPRASVNVVARISLRPALAPLMAPAGDGRWRIAPGLGAAGRF